MARKKGGALLWSFFVIPVYTKCSTHLLLAAASFWLWSVGGHRVMQTGERAFCGQRSQCETPIPTPGAPTLTHPQCSGTSSCHGQLEGYF